MSDDGAVRRPAVMPTQETSIWLDIAVVLGVAVIVAATVVTGVLMSPDISSVDEISSVVVTAIPVVVVAFFAMRYAPDDLPVPAREPLAVPIPDWMARLSTRSFFAGKFLQTLGNTQVHLVNDPSMYHQLRLQSRFQIAIDEGFIWRSASGLVLGLVPKVMGDHSRFSLICLGASVELLIWNLSALISYSALVSAVRYVRATFSAYVFGTRDSVVDPRFLRRPRERRRLQPDLQAWRVVLMANVMSYLCLVAGLWLAVMISTS